MKRLIFYNYYGNGDVHYSREFVKDIMKKIPADSYEYYHRHNPSILKDINNLKSLNGDVNLISDAVKINTWIGQNGAKYLKYNCSLYSNYLMFQDIYKNLDIEIESTVDYYIPTIDFSNINTDFIKEIERNDNFKVLISNGDVHSGQAANFDFDIIIDKLVNNSSDVIFFTTHNSKIKNDRVIPVSSFIFSDGDLNEISYLSTFCDIIVGRASGPFCFTHIQENYFDDSLTFVSISNDEREGKYYYGSIDDFVGKMPNCKLVHTNNYSYESMFKTIYKEIYS